MTHVEQGDGLPVTLLEATQALRSGITTSARLTQAMLDRAERLDAQFGVYLSRFGDEAVAAAEGADARRVEGADLGPLHGIPLVVKDVISTTEGPTSAQSLVLDPRWGLDAGDATVVARLRKAGAVIMGKTTTMEFATGDFDEDMPFPVPRNPWDPARFPGGSSTGTALAALLGLAYGGLGTDTGGSVRCPASYLGVTGLKPTYGLVPKSGCVPYAYSLDHVGPMARTAADCAALLDAVAGYEPTDRCSIRVAFDGALGGLSGDLSRLRIGVDVEASASLEPYEANRLDDALAIFRERGAEVTSVVVPFHEELEIASEVISRSEMFAYHRPDLRDRWSEYGRPFRQNALGGAMYSGADYVQAQRVRAVAQERVADLFSEVDLIAGPTGVRGAPLKGGLTRQGLVGQLFTRVWNVLGNPALSIPIGFDSDEMPIGMQLVGRPFEDALILRAGDAFQRVTDWHLRSPDGRRQGG